MHGKARRLARPATPLAVYVQRVSSVDEIVKNWLPRQRPRVKKLILDWSSATIVSTKRKNLAKISLVDFEIIEIIKLKGNVKNI